jgi:hypothetical protein
MDNKYKQAVHGLCPLQQVENCWNKVTLISKFEIKMNLGFESGQVDVV